MDKKPKTVRILEWIHFSVFLLIIGTIILLHIITQNFLDFLRMPPFLRSVDPLLGFGWPVALNVYHIILIFFILLTLINVLGLLFYQTKTWRIISDSSSLFSFLLIWPVGLFFVFTLASSETLGVVEVQTATFFFIFCFLLFLLDLITWFVDEQSLLKFQKRQ